MWFLGQDKNVRKPTKLYWLFQRACHFKNVQ